MVFNFTQHDGVVLLTNMVGANPDSYDRKSVQFLSACRELISRLHKQSFVHVARIETDYRLDIAIIRRANFIIDAKGCGRVI